MDSVPVYDYGYWTIAIVNVLIMSFIVLIKFKPKTKPDWKGMGAITGFFIALFTEMYGFPFSIYILTSWLGKEYPVVDPFTHRNGHLLRVLLGDHALVSLLLHPGSELIIIIGLKFIYVGWKRIHEGKGALIKTGLYKYMRHPQYTGFFLIIIGFLIQWPTILTLIMAPMLVALYNSLAQREENDMVRKFGIEYIEYMKNTPRYFQKFSRRKQ